MRASFVLWVWIAVVVVGGLGVLAVTFVNWEDQGPRKQACELVRAVTVDGSTRHSVRDGEFGGPIPCARAFFIGPPPADIAAVMKAPGFELSPSRGVFDPDPGSTDVLYGRGPGDCWLSVERYERVAMLHPWLGLADEQRAAIRTGESILWEIMVNCDAG